MPEPSIDRFDLVGDPDAVPDEFFEALAALLLSAYESDRSEKEKERR